MKILAIGNPISGGGLARVRMEQLAERLFTRGHEVEVYFTRAAGDAARRAERLEEGLDRLVVVGGDGTLNEVINGLRDPGSIPLAQLPTGTANLLVREFRLPWTAEGMVRLLETGTPHRLDLCCHHPSDGGKPRRFAMVASAGLDAAVVDAVHRARTGTLGMRRYILPLLNVLRAWEHPRVQVLVDDLDPIEGALAVIGNIRTYAGLFRVADRVTAGSGHLDVVVLPQDRAVDVAQYLLAAACRRLSRLPAVKYLTGRRVTVRSAGSVPVQIDGDSAGLTPLTVSVLPGALCFMMPAVRRTAP